MGTNKSGTAFWRDDVDEFLAWVQLERGLSPNTVASYEHDLIQFGEFLDQNSCGSWADVDETATGRFLESLTEAQFETATLSRKLSALRGFSAFRERERGAPSLTEIVRGPRAGRKVPTSLTLEETLRLLEAPSLATPHGLRDRAILELLYGSGLRVSELTGLLLQSLDLENRFVRVFGKGSKER
ncbi:MAG: site-specific integrase, partial [Puniceicoccales bacterium]